jgi:hypothetical protein
MSLPRITRHLLTTGRSLRRAFPRRALEAIERTIRDTEVRHRGQIRFAVEHALDLGDLVRGLSARTRALEVFSHLRVWDTALNNGVLIYVLLADRDVEIVADRGVHARVGTAGWEAICRKMEEAFRRGEFENAVVHGIQAVGKHLEAHFPASGPGPNELPDEPVIE